MTEMSASQPCRGLRYRMPPFSLGWVFGLVCCLRENANARTMVSEVCAGPIETTTTSVALPASFRRRASSTAISSNGFIDIFTLDSSTPVPSLLTRTLTL